MKQMRKRRMCYEHWAGGRRAGLPGRVKGEFWYGKGRIGFDAKRQLFSVLGG